MLSGENVNNPKQHFKRRQVFNGYTPTKLDGVTKCSMRYWQHKLQAGHGKKTMFGEG